MHSPAFTCIHDTVSTPLTLEHPLDSTGAGHDQPRRPRRAASAALRRRRRRRPWMPHAPAARTCCTHLTHGHGLEKTRTRRRSPVLHAVNNTSVTTARRRPVHSHCVLSSLLSHAVFHTRCVHTLCVHTPVRPHPRHALRPRGRLQHQARRRALQADHHRHTPPERETLRERERERERLRQRERETPTERQDPGTPAVREPRGSLLPS